MNMRENKEKALIEAKKTVHKEQNNKILDFI
jgi:hypothetical protein